MMIKFKKRNENPYLHSRSFPCIILVISVLIIDVESSIVDTRTPIVIQENGSSKDSKSDNYFGYSLAFMKGSLDDTSKPPQSSVKFDTPGEARGTLFIGAPNEKRAAKNSGVVWECKFDGREITLSCSIMSHLSYQNSPEKTTCQNSRSLYFPENETEQWIGASLAASSNQLLACAPRWKRNGWVYNSWDTCTESAMVGACYRASTSQPNIQVINPLNNPNKFYFLSVSPAGEQTNEYWYLYAELGFSSHITSSDSLLLGAPNVRKWTGAIVEYPTGTVDSNQPPVIHNERATFRDVESHSLLGYTVISGKIMYGKGYYIASGAPRAGRLHGVVTVSNSRQHDPIIVYKGTQFGSYFGYALATADLNGDGTDELLVGVPWHTSDFKSSSDYDTGCVMIFDVMQYNTQPLHEKLCMNYHGTSLKLSMGSRFGSAIANIGDINNDGKDDFVVSAPYSDDGIGTIFIYHGGYPPMEKLAQIVRGKLMGFPNLHGFGTYLLGGKSVDVDGNGTPDLIISSFESHQVFALRTRPIARPTLLVTFHTTESREQEGRIFKLLPTQQGFRVRVCIRFHFSIPLPASENKLETWLKYEVDSKVKESRVEFENPSEQSEHTIDLFSNKEQCLDIRLRRLAKDDSEDEVTPIDFQASLKYNYTELMDDEPVVESANLVVSSTSDQNRAFTQDSQYKKAYDNFNPYLPAPIQLKRSRVERLEIALDNCADNRRCDPDLQINLNLDYGHTDNAKLEQWSKGKTLVIGKVDLLVVTVVVSNHKETAYQPTVRIAFGISKIFEMSPDSLTFQWTQTPGKRGLCTAGESRTTEENPLITRVMRCAQPLQGGGREMKYVLEIGNLKHMKVKEKEVKGELILTVDAFPEFSEQDEKKSQTLKIPLEGEVAASVESRIPESGQSEIDPRKTSVVDLNQIYIIKNTGFSATSTDTVTVEILTPTHVNFNRGNNWTQVIGVADPSTVNIRCESKNFPFHAIQELVRNQKTPGQPAKPGHTRSSRSTSSYPPLKVIHPEKVSVSESSDKNLVLSGCKQDGKIPPESCQKIVCKTDLPSKGSREINMKMYLLKEAIGKLIKEETRGLRIESEISVTYLGKVIKAMGSTQREFILVKGVPAWIYLASGAGGTILFLLVTLGLFKCGFFKRKKKEELKQLKRQTMLQLDANALRALDASIQEEEETPMDIGN